MDHTILGFRISRHFSFYSSYFYKDWHSLVKKGVNKAIGTIVLRDCLAEISKESAHLKHICINSICRGMDLIRRGHLAISMLIASCIS